MLKITQLAISQKPLNPPKKTNGSANGSEVTYFKNPKYLKQSTLGYTYGQILDTIHQYALILHESVKKVVLDFWWLIAPPKCFGLGKKLANNLA